MACGDILLCDLDAFYASIEQRDNREYRGKPVIVGGDPEKRGVVSTCSYEARAFGVHSAMPVKTAKRLCPQGIYLPVDMKKYKKVSAEVLSIYERYTPLIEVVSIDEAYLEVRGGEGLTTAQGIRKAVREELELTVSIGISSNKLLAKICSNLAKPDGCKEIRPAQAVETLSAYSPRILPGIGPKTLEKLHLLGIDTVGRLSALPLEWFIHHFGARGEELYEFAHWQDNRPLLPERDAKSLGEEVTFPQDIARYEEIYPVLNNLCETVGYRLRRHNLRARTLTLKIRYSDFRTVTRSATPGRLIYTDGEIFACAVNLFRQLSGREAIRLVGVQLSNLSKEKQLSLFEETGKEEKLAEMVDQLKNRFGENAIRRGVGLQAPQDRRRS